MVNAWSGVMVINMLFSSGVTYGDVYDIEVMST